MAAFEACSARLDETQSLVLQGVGDLAEKMNGWFFHTFTAPSGVLLRCDATPADGSWHVSVSLAEYTDDVPRYPELVRTPQNEKFADFWEIKSALMSKP
jgi:hypothetical protein